MASNYLTIARDFGLLEGAQRKIFTRLYVPLPSFVYVLYRLKDKGRSNKAIVTSDDFKLFLMDQRDVYLLPVCSHDDHFISSFQSRRRMGGGGDEVGWDQSPQFAREQRLRQSQNVHCARYVVWLAREERLSWAS